MIKNIQIRIDVTIREEPVHLTPEHPLSTEDLLSLWRTASEMPFYEISELKMVPHRENYVWVGELRQLVARNSAYSRFSGQIHGRISPCKPHGISLRR